MRRSIVWFVPLLLLLLAACTSAGTPASTVAPSPLPPDRAQAGSTPATQATESVATTTEPTKPAATPDMDKVLKPQSDDHKLGPDGAPVTIIEWGDFQ